MARHGCRHHTDGESMSSMSRVHTITRDGAPPSLGMAWSRIHLDFAGPFLGHMFLVIVDAHSKWLDVHQMQSITSSKTIDKLRIVCTTHGLPQKVVTDNGPSFTSEEFRTFMSLNGIVHVTTSPYHPSSNGLAERALQTFKQGLKCTPGSTIQERLSNFLFTYRITPHTTTGVPPVTLLMGRLLTVQVIKKCPDVLSVLLSTDSTTVRSTVSTTVHSTVSTTVHSTVSTYVRYASKKSVR